MKSIFQFTHTTTNAIAHIIVDGTKFALVNAHGLPLTSEITSSDFSPMLVVTAKKLGYKMTGIQQFEIIFEQVAEETANQVNALVDAVAVTMSEIAQVIETQAIEIQDLQEDESRYSDEIASLRGMLTASFKSLETMQANIKALTLKLDSCMDKLMEASGEVLIAECFQTTEESENEGKASMIESAYHKAQILGLNAEITAKDRLVLTYGKTEYTIIAQDACTDLFTLCQSYDREGRKARGKSYGEYVNDFNGLLDFLDTIEDDMIKFDDECEEWEENQG